MVAMPAPLLRLRDSVLSIGVRQSDSVETRLRKEALVLTVVTITILSTIWTGVYFALGLPFSAALPFAYQVISVISLVYFARTGNFNVLRLVQVGTILILPFALQWSAGGFENSSAVMVWAFASPLGALVFFGPRAAAVFFAGYIALAVLSGVVDSQLPVPKVLPDSLRLAFYVLNIGGVSLVTYAVLQYFVSARERAQAETVRLLHNVLPASIADRLIAGEEQIADDHDAVTVVFADVAGFTPLARRSEASEVISLLNMVFTAFDRLAELHGLEKIKTIGDAYMAVAGAPTPRADHASAAADMALDMQTEIGGLRVALGQPLELRIGLHSGPAAAGVIGRRKFAYDLWGDAVNVASRMETQGVPGRIHCSAAVWEQLHDRYRFEERGVIDVKGLGEMRTYFLVGKA